MSGCSGGMISGQRKYSARSVTITLRVLLPLVGRVTICLNLGEILTRSSGLRSFISPPNAKKADGYLVVRKW